MWPDLNDDNNEDCMLAERFATATSIKLIMYVQMVLAIIICIASFMVVRRMLKKPPAAHSNFLILIINLIAYILIFSATCIVTPIFTTLQYMFYENPCELLFKSWLPVLIRSPLYFYIFGIAFLHIILFFERLAATYFCHAYETSAGKGCGIFATAVLWTISGICFFYAFCEGHSNHYRTFISSTSPHNAGKVFLISVICTLLDICSILLDYVLYRHNKKMQDNSNVMKWQNYKLRRNYQLRENQRTIHLMLYLSVVHSAIYLTYSVLNLLIRIHFEKGDPVLFVTLLEACLIIISLHALTMLGILNYYLKYSQTRKFIVEDVYAAKDMYFIQFKRQLEGLSSANVQVFAFP